MYMTKQEYETIRLAFEKILKSDQWGEFEYRTEESICFAIMAITNINERYKSDVAKVAKNISEKRKVDKCYGRSKAYKEAHKCEEVTRAYKRRTK